MGDKVDEERKKLVVHDVAFSFHRHDTYIQIVAHSHCKKLKTRDNRYYFLYNYYKSDDDIMTVLKDFVIKSEDEIKKYNMEIVDIKDSFYLFKTIKNVINSNQIPHIGAKLIYATCKCFDERKPIQLEAGGIEKPIYLLLELCSIYKKFHYIIPFIDDPMFEHPETVQVYINQNVGEGIIPAGRVRQIYEVWADNTRKEPIKDQTRMEQEKRGDEDIHKNHRIEILKRKIPLTYNNSIDMGFVQIPAGDFDMGSPSNEEGRWDNEGPVHQVNISKAFYMSKYEVTQKQWRDVMGSSPSYFKGDDLPVESVSWNDVQDFIKKLNEKEGGNKYRLPSEAEWEYAARAGTATRYSFGDDESKLGDYAWYMVNSGDKTHDVGQKKPNPWGLYDMHGNVWEWVQDIYIMIVIAVRPLTAVHGKEVTPFVSLGAAAGASTPGTAG
jgi:formylglycine-generating enzyme required for sulfatase activity